MQNGVNGFVCEPTPEGLAQSLRRLMEDPALAETMGRSARQSAARLTWADAVAALTAVD